MNLSESLSRYKFLSVLTGRFYNKTIMELIFLIIYLYKKSRLNTSKKPENFQLFLCIIV